MEQTSQERFFTMAEAYDKMCQLLVPQYDFFQDEVLKILSFKRDEEFTVIDLGAGSGIFLEKILKRYSHVKCYWIDYSEDFLKVAKRKFARLRDKVEYILSPIENEWESKIDEKVDAIFSMSTIHHLESEEKRRLYQRCFKILKNPGWFFNIDEMKTIYKDAYLNSLYLWSKHVENGKNRITKEQISLYNKWKAHFDDWRLRNIDNIDKPKTKGDDIHENFIQQIEWLKEIGYVNVDLFIKYHLWCVIGGQKWKYSMI